MGNLVMLLEQQIAKRPEAPFIKRAGDAKFVAYGEFGKMVRTITEDVQERCQAEPIVCLYAENGPMFAAGLFGLWAAGKTVIPIDVKLTPDEIRNIVADSAATTFYVSEAIAKKHAEKGLQLPAEIHYQILEQVVQNRREKPSAALNDNATAIILYSSGTTGKPKGVCLSHHNLYHNVTACAKVLEIGPEDNFLALLPLNHAFALTTLLLLPVPTGAKVTTLASLGPQDLLAALKKENITIMTVVPAIARLLAQMLKRKNLEGLGAKRGAALFGEKFRLLVCGGAVLSPTIEREINEAGVPVVQGYGLSENSPVVAVNPPHANRIGSVGVPLKGVTVRLGPTNERGEGELRIGGESVMQGYFNRPEATADVLKNGELHTGDIASIDADGYIHICGRSKNVIITENGKNVYPEEIESELAKCPLIKECAVVGLKREDKGAISEEIVAAVTLQSEAIAVHLQMTPEQIHLENKALQEAMSEVVRSFCLNLADYKRVERTVLLAEMPRTSSGKVRVSELKELLKRI